VQLPEQLLQQLPLQELEGSNHVALAQHLPALPQQLNDLRIHLLTLVGRKP
jgi:hypothetical protein